MPLPFLLQVCGLFLHCSTSMNTWSCIYIYTPNITCSIHIMSPLCWPNLLALDNKLAWSSLGKTTSPSLRFRQLPRDLCEEGSNLATSVGTKIIAVHLSLTLRCLHFLQHLFHVYQPCKTQFCRSQISLIYKCKRCLPWS